MKKSSFLFFSVIVVLTTIIIYSCGGDDDVITNQSENGNCGPHHQMRWPVLGITNKFVSGGIRTYQHSAIFLTIIGGLCTKTEPTVTASAIYTQDTAHPFNLFLAVRVTPLFGVDQPGTYSNGVWNAHYSIGLEQSFAEGPGEIIDLRIDVKFPTTGSDAGDSILYYSKFTSIGMLLEYDDYLAHTSDNLIKGKDLKELVFIFDNRKKTVANDVNENKPLSLSKNVFVSGGSSLF